MQRVGHYPDSGSLKRPALATSLSNTPCPNYIPVSPLPAHLLLAGDLTIHASNQPSLNPTVYVFRSSINSGLLIPYQPSPNLLVSVTALALDHSSANIRIAIFYSDSTWTIHTIDYERHTSTLVYSHTAIAGLPIIQSAYHHPLLVTITPTFRMSIFYLPPASAPPVLKYTLSSYSGFSPLTMTLSRYRTPDQYRVLLAHASPIYPAHWAPSATDIMLSMPHSDTPSATVKILSSASTNNNLPLGWIPDGTPDGVPEELRLRWSRKVSHASGIQTDGKFVVFASEDGGIQVSLHVYVFEWLFMSVIWLGVGVSVASQCSAVV